MSFCQKHFNHHCIHAHNCTNPQHKKAQNLKEKGAGHNKSSGGLKLPNNKKQSCHFIGVGKQKHCYSGDEEVIKLLKQRQTELKQLQQALVTLQDKYDKLGQENKHLYTQIQYYREQFASLIGNNSTDNRNQIKKRLKETTDLSLKVKSLQNQNLRLSNENEGLRQLIHDDKINRAQNIQINGSLQDKYNSLHGKLVQLDREKEQYKIQWQSKIKEVDKYQEKYKILNKELGFECDIYRRQNKQLSAQLESVKKQLNKIKNTFKKQKQLLEIQKESSQSKENILKSKLAQYQNQNKQLARSVRQLTQKYENLEQDFIHAKRLFQKNGQASKQNSELQRQLNDRFVETKTVIRERPIQRERPSQKERPIQRGDNKQNQPASRQNQKLKQQIITLKIKITQLQQHNTKHFEEVIMNIGASQAFKKLILEKNQVIKKLMREKGEIYTDIINSKY